MSVLYITEYAALTQLPGDAGQMPDENSLTAEQTMAITAGSTTSLALNPGTKYVRLNVDSTAAAAIKFGYGSVGTPPTPTAVVATGTIGSKRFAPNQTEFSGVPTNGNGSGNNQVQVKIAVIATT